MQASGLWQVPLAGGAGTGGRASQAGERRRVSGARLWRWCSFRGVSKTSRVGCDVIACQRLALVGRPRRVGGWQASWGRPLPDLVEVQRVWGLARAHVCSAPSGLAGRRVPAGGSGPAPQSTRTASALMGKRGTQTWQETSRLCWSPPRATDRRPPRSPPQRHPEASALQKPHHTQCLQPGRESHPHPALEDATAEGEGRQAARHFRAGHGGRRPRSKEEEEDAGCVSGAPHRGPGRGGRRPRAVGLPVLPSWRPVSRLPVPSVSQYGRF